MVQKTPAYKNRLKPLEVERNGGAINKKKSNKQMDKKTEEDLSKELDLQITGAGKPLSGNFSVFAFYFYLTLFQTFTLVWSLVLEIQGIKSSIYLG
ncbi:hypothetical protein CsatA_021075 [Cannabis sativa]